MLCAAIAAAAPDPRPADGPQGVRITRTDGSVVEGELEAYERGRYKILRKDGGREDIEEGRVQEIVLTDAPAVEAPAPAAREPELPAAAEEVRSALERGDTGSALQKVLNAVEGVRTMSREIQSMAVRVYEAHLPRLLEGRDATGLSEALRRLPEALPPEVRGDVLARLAERLAELVKEAPDDPFTAAFSESAARLMDEGARHAEVRTALADHFVRLGRRQAEAGNAPAAAALYHGALKLDPGRRAELKDGLVEAAVETGRRRLAAGDARGALEAAGEAIELEPTHEAARRLAEEAEFELIKRKVDSSLGRGSEDILRAFLSKAGRPEHRRWAAEALARLAAEPAPDRSVLDEIDRYFPVRAGSYLVYQRADGEVRHKVKTESVSRQKDSTRVRYTVQEIVGGALTSRSYELEIVKDAVLLPAGREREVLLRFPLRAGDAWAWRTANQEFRRTVKALGQTVQAGQGDRRRTFEDCAVIEFTSSSAAGTRVSRSTYAPGVGLVKLEFLDPEHRRFSMELVEAGAE